MLSFANIGRFMAFASIAVLASGTILFLVKKHFSSRPIFGAYIVSLFLLEFLSKKLSLAVDHNNLILFSISSFVHFGFMSWIYFHYFFNGNAKKIVGIILLGLLPLLISSWDIHNIDHFQSYDRLFHDLAIILYALFLFYKGFKESRHDTPILLFNSAVLFYFSVDFFLAVGTNFLINQDLVLVSWFWTARGLFLQLFYIALIYFAWNSGKNQ